MKHYNLVSQATGNKPDAATAFQISNGTATSATGAPPFRLLSDVASNGDLVPYFAWSGAKFERGVGTFTSGTPSTLVRTTILGNDSGTTSAVDFSGLTDNPTLECSWSANMGQSSYLYNVAGGDADTTLAVGEMCVINGSAIATANRTYTLPANADVGDRVGVMMGSATAFAVILAPATGDTINGGTAGAEWSRLLMAGEVVIFRCVTANTAWIIEHDGRIPIVVKARHTTGGTWTINVDTYPAWDTRDIDNSACYQDLTKDCFRLRRAGSFFLSTTVLTPTLANAKALYVNLRKDPNGTPVALGHARYQASFAERLGATVSTIIQAAAGDDVTASFQQSNATGAFVTGAGNEPSYVIHEILR